MKAIPFKQKVFAIVRKIPAGKVMSYGAVAAAAGNPKAARAVGAALRTNFDPAIPCHRVVAANGALTGYNRGIAKKKEMLEREGAMAMISKLANRKRHQNKEW